MFSADANGVLQPRTWQLCRVLLGVRLVVAVFAVLMLGPDLLSFTTGIALVFAVATSAGAFFGWRRIAGFVQRHPLLLGLDTLVSLMVLTLGGRASPFLLFTVVVAAIAGLLYRWGGMLYVTGLQMICFSSAVAIEPDAQGATDVPLLVLYYPLAGFAGLWVRRLLDTADNADKARRDAEVAAAADRERTRLARDMHDSLAKTVRGIAFGAAALPNWIRRDTERAEREANQIAAAAEVASREARELLTDLRTGQVDQPLVSSIQEICGSWAEHSGVAVETTLTDDIDLDVGPRYEMVNVLREALSNIERHARATAATVSLARHEGRTALTIHDDGTGFDPDSRDEFVATGHYGLLGMSERARRADGELTVTSEPGAGTTVTFALPSRETKRNGVKEPSPKVTTNDASSAELSVEGSR